MSKPVADVDLFIMQLEDEDLWRWLVRQGDHDIAEGTAPTLAAARFKAELVAQSIVAGR